jgi:hypothetical protein
MATSLESQLITGAGQAVAKDPYGIVMQAQERASQKISEGVKGIAKNIGDIKAAKLAEEEKLQKEKDDELKGYDDNWETNQIEVIDNQGLGKVAWGQATDLAEKQKAVHDACPPGQEGNRCRREAIIDLKSMAQKYSDQKDSLQGYVDTQKKIKNGEIDLSKAQSEDAKKILAGLNDRNSSNRMKNDDEIAELRESLNSANPEEQIGIEQQIEALEKSNEQVVGWDIPGVDKDGNAFGFMTAEDLDKANLLPVAASEIKLNFKEQQDEVLKTTKSYIKGDAKGEDFDFDEAATTYGDLITSKNMKSVFKDPLYGGKETLEDHLREHPAITNLNYADLGIEIPETDDDGVIDPEEWAKLSASDIDRVINAISDDEDLAKEVGGNYMALKTQRAVNKEMYGKDFYKLSDAEKNVRIKLKTTQNPGETDAEYDARGGIKGVQKGMDMVWDPVAGKSVAKKGSAGGADDIVG